MKRILLLAVFPLLLCGCPSEDDGSCVEGEAQCVGDRTIQYCDGETWGPEESCQPQEVGGGQFIETVCYPDQGRCAP